MGAVSALVCVYRSTHVVAGMLCIHYYMCMHHCMCVVCVIVCAHMCMHARTRVCLCVKCMYICMHCHIMWHMFMHVYMCEKEYVHLCCISFKVQCKDCMTHFLSRPTVQFTFTGRQATNIPLSSWFTANGNLLLIRKLFLGKSVASVTVESNLWPVLSVCARHRHVGWARDGGASCNTVLLWV